MNNQNPPEVDRNARCLTNGSPVTGDHREIDPSTGQQKGYVVLTEAERAKGFVRPVRNSYTHVGARPKHPTRDLTPEELERYAGQDYMKFETYPAGGPTTGRFWTARDLASGCGTRTTMGQALAETYARDPSFYSGTFCCHCREHFPVGESGEFVWADGSKVGT
ncbi:MAG: hypothetical protein ABFD89_17500 [Bryobacteraceae bacterium]